jgi:hypothetical protein
MKPAIEYTVMGEDGKEYGPVSAKDIRQWVTEQRLEKKTPIKPPGARDWIFLGDVPEFAGLFARKFKQPVNCPPTARVPPRPGLVKAFIVVVLAAAAYYIYQYTHPQ